MIATVIGLDDVIDVTPTLDTSAYATGDRLGSIHTITGAFRNIHRDFDPLAIGNTTTNQKQTGKVILTNVHIIDQAKQSVAMDILFFDVSPTVASADNAAIDITDAEMLAKNIGSVSIDASYIALANNSVVTQRNINLELKQSTAATDQNLYAVVIVRGAPTYAAGSLKFKYAFLQD